MKVLILLLISFNASADSILFAWAAPTEYIDNTPINNNLAGFNIYYGNLSGIYSLNININDPLATSYTLPNVGSGTYYSVITAYDISGAPSAYSQEVSVNILPTPLKPPTSFSAVALP